jgi:hypothetical protein
MFKILNNFISFFNNIRYLNSYKTIKILNRKIKFFTPNKLTNWRIETFFTKEPETLEWINSFKNKDKFIFWDVGSNIGLYSIYNALKNKNSITRIYGLGGIKFSNLKKLRKLGTAGFGAIELFKNFL